MVIDGADLLANDRGTAPGQWIEESGSVVMILPGSASRIEGHVRAPVPPAARRIVPPLVIRTLVFACAGMSESDLDQTISPVYKHYVNPVTTVLAHNGDIQVHLRARCATEGEAWLCWPKSAAAFEPRWEIASIHAMAIPSRSLSGRTRRTTCHPAVAESATGGGLAERISSVPGSSAYFLGGFVTYSRRMKMDLLGVPEEILKDFGLVSRETAEAMASAPGTGPEPPGPFPLPAMPVPEQTARTTAKTKTRL